MQPKWKIAIASLALTASASLAGPAALAGAAPAQQQQEAQGRQGDAPARLRKICARVPNLMTRIENAINRLEGDSDVRSSLAWLQARIDRAQANGRDELATVLENRLEVRTARLDLMKKRLASLQEIDAICDEHGA